MADNITVNPTSGVSAAKDIAFDDVGSVFFQKVKLDVGGDGLSVPVVGTLPTAPNVTRGGGALDANTQRVTLATDGPGVLALTSIDSKTPALVGGRQPVDGSGVTQPVSGPLTDTQLRATAVPVSGPLTDTQIRATALPVSGPLTDAQLRAAAVPISAAALPLPSGAATETTLAALNTKQPALGARLAATGSSPVVLSNEDVLDQVVTGQGSQLALNNNVILATAGAGSTDCQQYRQIAFMVVPAAGTITAGTIVFEGSNDNVNFVAVPLSDAAAPNTAPVTTYALVAATTRYFEGPIKFRHFRARISVAVTGTTTGVQAFSILRMTPFIRSNAGQAVIAGGTLPAVTTVTTVSTVSNLAAIAAGTNAIGDVGVQGRANATGAMTPFKVQTAATTNAAAIKASAGRVFGWSLTNTSAAARVVRFYNLAVAPTVGTSVPIYNVVIPAGQTVTVLQAIGVAHTAGIAIAVTAGLADNDATVTAANDVIGTVFFL